MLAESRPGSCRRTVPKAVGGCACRRVLLLEVRQRKPQRFPSSLPHPAPRTPLAPLHSAQPLRAATSRGDRFPLGSSTVSRTVSRKATRLGFCSLGN